MVEWEATDQFGNLYVAASEARSPEELKEDLSSLIGEALLRASGRAEFAVDAAYGEVSAPSGSQVSHVLSVPWLSERMHGGEDRAAIEAEVQDLLRAAFPADQADRCLARGPWD